jgi:hypothetical protein
MSRWKFLPEKISKRVRAALQEAIDSNTSIIELEPMGLPLSYLNVLTERLHIFTIKQLLALEPDQIITRGLKKIAIGHIKAALLRYPEHSKAIIAYNKAMVPNIYDLHLLRLAVEK